MLRNIYHYRYYLVEATWSDFRYRYAGTVVGLYWFIVNPLLEVLVYTIVFSYLINVRSSGRNASYVVFLVTGLFPWLSFTTTIKDGTNSLIKNSPYLRKMNIPPEIFVTKTTLLSFFNLCIYLVLLVVFMFFSGYEIGWTALLLPFIALLMQILAFGISLITAHLQVLFPDIGEVLPTFLQIWRWSLPVMYSLSIFPDSLQRVLRFNPPYYYLEAFRLALLDQKVPDAEAWIYMIIWAGFTLLVGFWVSSQLKSDVIDEL